MESPTDFLVSFVSADPSWKPSIRQNTEDVILTNKFCFMQSHTRLRYHIIMCHDRSQCVVILHRYLSLRAGKTA